MKKPLVTVECGGCHGLIGCYSKKDVPKSFVCPHCNLGQTTVKREASSHSMGRNYPEGYYPAKMNF